MTEDQERIRYDRQIRLWGKTTQQRLRKTHLRFLSLRGALSEVAKNLVLAGVHAVDAYGATTVTAHDVASNFLVQSGLEAVPSTDATFEQVCVRSLQKLNPHVTCTAHGGAAVDGDGDGDSNDAIRVVLASAGTLREVDEVVAAHASADLVVVTVSTVASGGVLALFFHRGSAVPDTLSLLSHPATLAERPAGYQAAVLALHLGKGGADFAEALAAAVEAVETLRLHELTPEAVQLVVDGACRPADARDEVSVVLATQAGACIAQQVIAAVGEGVTSVSWMLCHADPAMEALVG